MSLILKGQLHSKTATWLAMDLFFSYTAEVLTTASNTAAVKESSWLWNTQMWGWHWFCSTDLSCRLLQKRKKKLQRIEHFISTVGSESDGKRGWLRGSGWTETRWDTGTADGPIFQSFHHGAGSSQGEEHLLFHNIQQQGYAVHFIVLT